MPTTPMILVDECANNALVKRMIIKALNAGLATGAGPVWKHRRIRSDGSLFYVDGTLPRYVNLQRGRGQPDKGFSWPDEHVASWVLGYLIHSKVVFLSENTRLNQRGIRHLLRNVAPYLQEKVSLTSLFKKGRTSHEVYCEMVYAFLAEHEFKVGYTEVLY